MIYNGVSGVADQTWGIESPSLQELGGSTQREEEECSSSRGGRGRPRPLPPPQRGMARGAEKRELKRGREKT